jgi:predicted enzyme involved in methoxymalonyl-ACP biosynthesis
MGKKVEEALLGYTIGRAQAAGATRILAEPADGPRNAPAKQFFANKLPAGVLASVDAASVKIPTEISLRAES